MFSPKKDQVRISCEYTAVLDCNVVACWGMIKCCKISKFMKFENVINFTNKLRTKFQK